MTRDTMKSKASKEEIMKGIAIRRSVTKTNRMSLLMRTVVRVIE